MESRIFDMKKLLKTEAEKVIERVLISFIDEDGRLSDVTRIIGKKNAGDEERKTHPMSGTASFGA
ncbi:hypothetical protein MAP00_001646 [Monascus purpureus]|nr:hypothetical protein MAP00_001646 [Monascus purpureus]